MNSPPDDPTAPTEFDRICRAADRVAYLAALPHWVEPDVTRYPHVFKGAAFHLLSHALPTSSGQLRGAAELIDAAQESFNRTDGGLLTAPEWDQVVAALVEHGALVPWTVDLGDGDPPQTVGYTRPDGPPLEETTP